MRHSFLSAVFAASLLLKCSVLTGASPLSLPDDGSVEQDALAALLADKDHEAEPEERPAGPRIIVVADPGLWRELRALHGAGLAKRRNDHGDLKDAAAAAGQDLNIPILRRDSMRCMVGRVYRPCWEV